MKILTGLSRFFKITSFLLFLGISATLPFGLTGCGSGDYTRLQSAQTDEGATSQGHIKTVKTSVLVGNASLQAVGGVGTTGIPDAVLSIKIEVRNVSDDIMQSLTKNVLVDSEPLTFEFEFSAGQILKFFAYGFDDSDGTGNKLYQGQTAAPVEISEGMAPITIGLIRIGTGKAPELKNVTLQNSGSTATLSATVNPAGAGHVVTTFEWGLTSDSGSPPNISNDIVLSGDADVDVNHTIHGLLPGTEYFFNITARNNEETVSSTNTFVTPILVSNEIIFPKSPAIVSLSSLNITGTSATLETDVTPNGAASIIFFDWGTTSDLEYSSPVISIANNLWNTSPHTVSHNITGLQPGTTYNFRITILNSESLLPATMYNQFTTN